MGMFIHRRKVEALKKKKAGEGEGKKEKKSIVEKVTKIFKKKK